MIRLRLSLVTILSHDGKHAEKNNVNGKQPAVIENNTEKPQQRVDDSDVTNKDPRYRYKRKYEQTEPTV